MRKEIEKKIWKSKEVNASEVDERIFTTFFPRRKRIFAGLKFSREWLQLFQHYELMLLHFQPILADNFPDSLTQFWVAI